MPLKLTRYSRFCHFWLFVLFFSAPCFGQETEVQEEVVIDRPLRIVFHDTRKLIYGVPMAEPEVLLRYDGTRIDRIGRKSDQAVGLELPERFEHNALLVTKDDRLVTISNPTKQVAVIDLFTLDFEITTFSDLGIEGNVSSFRIAKDTDKWLSVNQEGDTAHVYEWEGLSIVRSFSFYVDEVLESSRLQELGPDTIMVNAYPAGTYLLEWNGHLIKEFNIADFRGASFIGRKSSFTSLSFMPEREDGKILGSTRWYSPHHWEYKRKEMMFSPAPYPFVDQDMEFVHLTPIVDQYGNSLYSGGSFMPPYDYTLVRADGKRIKLGKETGLRAIWKEFRNEQTAFLDADLSKYFYAWSLTGELLRISLPQPRIKSFISEFGYLRPLLLSPDSMLVSSFRHGIYHFGNPSEQGILVFRHYWYKEREGVIREGKDLARGADGRIWANDELLLFGVDQQTNEAVEIPLPGAVGNDWAMLPGHKALIALRDGRLVRVDLSTGDFRDIQQPEGAASGEIVTVQAQTDGGVLLGTTQGSFRGVPDKEAFGWSPMLPQAPENPTVYDIYEEQADRWWLATDSGWIGINPRTKEVREHYTTAEGLASNEVRSTVFAKGYYWIGTRAGLSRFNPRTKEFRTFSFEEGFSSRKFTAGAIYAPGLNLVGAGTDNGFNYFHPEDLIDEAAPAISLSSLKYYDSGKDTVVFDVGTAHLHKKIFLPAAHRALELTFFIDEMSDPLENVFAYRIGEKNADWIELKNESRLSFNALPAGTQLLEIRGRTRFSAWSEPFTLRIEVAAFFYNSWWFRILLISVLAGIAGAWIYRLRRESENLKLKVEERTATIRRDKETIEQQTRDLKELDAAKTRFFANISHEFRTPLTVIRGFTTELLKPENHNEAGKLQQGIGMIAANSDRLLLLVNQLLELGKLEAGKLEVRYQRIDLRPELDLIYASFQAVAQEKKLRMMSAIGFTELMMDADVDKLLKILYNLFSNAVKFSPSESTLTLSAKVTATEEVEISVRDTGIGIPADKLETIFQRFSQVDDGSTRKEEGSGIGLNFARELAMLMGGQLTVQSREGEGSIFTLTLPRWQAGSETAVAAAAALPYPVNNQGSVQNESLYPASRAPDKADEPENEPLLLLVEDNPDIIAYLKLCLGDGYRLLAARNGQEGLALALEMIPDLVITDVMMPVMDGLELCRRLKKEECTSHIPVIMLTALSSVKNRVNGLREGADAYLSKPFSREELTSQVNNLLENRRRLQAHFSLFAAGQQPNAVTDSVEEKDYTDTERVFLAKAIAIVERRLSDPELRTDDLARELLLSKSQLWRKVKAVTGLSTGQLIESVRLEKATGLLAEGKLSVAEVGYLVGYGDPSYFTKRFSKRYGVVPSAYTG